MCKQRRALPAGFSCPVLLQLVQRQGEAVQERVQKIPHLRQVIVLQGPPGLSGGTSSSPTSGHGSVSFTTQFQDLLDVSQVTAVRVGDVTIPLE